MMRVRSVLAVGFALGAAMVLLVSPVLAGGWAVTTLDTLPTGGMRAGEPYPLTYTIRRHGQTPFDGANTEIRVRAVDSGETISFRGIPGDGPGRYMAEVRFPASGEWTWLVTQDPFGPQQLGSLTILPPLPSTTTAPADRAYRSADAGLLFGGLAALAAAGLAIGLLSNRRRYPVRTAGSARLAA